MQLSTIDKTQTMTSREIAKLTNKQHKHVLRDIRTLVTQLKEGGGDTNGFVETTEKDKANRDAPIFGLTFLATCDLITGYDPVARQNINRRWYELEQDTKPKPLTHPEALRLLADTIEQLETAVATKAEIGSRREATSMATASVATKKENKLERELDQAKDYATIKRMETLNYGFKFKWRLLKSASQDLGINTIDVFDQNYGTVKAYHKDAWKEAYALDI